MIKKEIKRFILVIDNASFHVSKKTKQFIERQSDDWLTVYYQHVHHFKSCRNKGKKKSQERRMCKL